jgi:hypothetical protein
MRTCWRCAGTSRETPSRLLVKNPVDWAWSSCRGHVGITPAADWLDTDGLHGQMLGRAVRNGRDRAIAARKYAALVGGAREADSSFWSSRLQHQVFLGDDDFVE